MTAPRDRADRPSAPVTALIAIVGVSSLVLAVRVLRAGYGADNDTFLMLGTWDVLVDTGRYVPSRYQGYPVAEILVGASADVGGHWGSGGLALLFGVGCIAALDRLLRPRTVDLATRLLLLAVLAATPAFVIASSTSIDYVYGLFFFLFGWVMLERGSTRGLVLGVVSLVLASGARVTYLPAGLILIAATRRTSGARRVAAVAVCAVASVAWYLPAWRHHGNVSDLLAADRPTGQGVSGLVARAGGDGVGLLGLVGTAMLCALLVIAIKQRWSADAHPDADTAVAPWALGSLAAYFAVMWFAVPVEPAYLLPLLAVALVAVAPIRGGRTLLVVTVVMVMMHGWIVFEPYRIEYSNRYGVDSCDPTEAIDATLAIEVSAGDLLTYPDAVADAAACNDALREAFVTQWTSD